MLFDRSFLLAALDFHAGHCGTVLRSIARVSEVHSNPNLPHNVPYTISFEAPSATFFDRVDIFSDAIDVTNTLAWSNARHMWATFSSSSHILEIFLKKTEVVQEVIYLANIILLIETRHRSTSSTSNLSLSAAIGTLMEFRTTAPVYFVMGNPFRSNYGR